MTTVLDRPDLSHWTTAELARCYGTGSDLDTAIEAETGRRHGRRNDQDRPDGTPVSSGDPADGPGGRSELPLCGGAERPEPSARNAARSRNSRRLAAEPWRELAEPQYEAASRELNGVLLNRRGIAAGISPWPDLWRGPWQNVEPFMSFELLRWFEQHRRITQTELTRQEDKAMEVYRDDLERDDACGVRQNAGEGPENAGVHRVGAGHDVPEADARDAHPVRLPPAAARPGPVRNPGHVRGPAVITATRTRDDIRASISARAAQIADMERDRPDGTPAACRLTGDPADGPAIAAYPSRESAGPILAGQVAVREPSAAVSTRRAEIDGDQVLRYIYTFLKRFAVWGSDAEIVCAALWIAHTYARDGKGMPVWQYCARLGILGPSGSGKSWKSRLIGKLACSGEILIQPTKPAFISLCAENHTIVLTEADEEFRSPGRSRGIVSIVNASYEPDRKTSLKQGGVAVKIPLFCHVVLDGIDDVLLSPNRPDLKAMMSRVIKMMSSEAPPDPGTGEAYRPPRFDRQARAIAEQLSTLAGSWIAQEVADGMADDVPVVPKHLGNRPFGLWEALFTVAARADRCIARREGSDAGESSEPGPWSRACADACEVLEAGGPVIDADESAEPSELDRQMAEWSELL